MMHAEACYNGVAMELVERPQRSDAVDSVMRGQFQRLRQQRFAVDK